MFTSLNSCLIANKAILGPNLEKLGKTQGGFFNGFKYMLSYDKKTGFTIQKLNNSQLLLRTLSGEYKSTHLSGIFIKLSKLKTTEDVKACHTRIHNFWVNKYVIGLGNSELSKAKLICFAETHEDLALRAYMRYLINHSYEEGDIILVEGVKASRVGPTNDPWTQKIKPGCIVRGWEGEELDNLLNSPAQQKSNAFHREIMHCTKLLNKPFIAIDLADFLLELQDRINYLKQKFNEMQNYIQSTSPLLLNVNKIIDEKFQDFENGHLKITDYLDFIFKIILELEKGDEAAFYRERSKESRPDISEIRKAARQRNVSLVNEIETSLKTGKKVYVIAGAAHLYKAYGNDDSAEEVKKTLHKHQFIIITKKNDFHWSRALDNQDLLEKALH